MTGQSLGPIEDSNRGHTRLGLVDLLQPLGGLYGTMTGYRSLASDPRFSFRVARLGAIQQLLDGSALNHEPFRNKRGVTGSGIDLTDERAKLLALAEGLERYCTCIHSEDQFIVATAHELGVVGLDLDTIPRCSAAELSHPRCPLVLPDKTSPIRWIRGLSLCDGRLVYIPAVMVYSRLGGISKGERICLPISTGCAAHVSYEKALLNGIFEVVERDAISIIWLQQLTLPRVTLATIPPALAPYWARYERGSTECLFFDGTTDFGIPTIYGLQLSHSAERATLVSCSTDFSFVSAIAKVIRDMVQLNVAFQSPPRSPKSYEDCKGLLDGATFLARAENSTAFNFLLKSTSERPLNALRPLEDRNDRDNLAMVVDIFRRKQVDVYAVDLSTDEALRAGMRVVRVVIPALQPLSFNYRARYLGHPRLYQAPRSMGYPVCSEQNINHWPQPFA
jgi:ribosomal protein S12 methylthiotransferase accessory factor